MRLTKISSLLVICVAVTGLIAGCGCETQKNPADLTEPTSEINLQTTEEESISTSEAILPETGKEETRSTEIRTEPSGPSQTTETPSNGADSSDTKNTEPSRPGQMTDPTESTEEDWLDNLPENETEDTRPPIDATVSEETKPYTAYEKYNDMSAEEQEAFYHSFDTPADFFDWYNRAKEEYERSNPPVIIDGSTNVEIVP